MDLTNPASSRPWLIALDLDGTTIDYDGYLRPRVRDAVAAVVEAGHVVVPATGRTVLGTVPIAEQLGLSGPGVCSNGAVEIVLDPQRSAGHEITTAVTFDPRPVLDKLRDAWPGAVLAVEVIGQGHKVSAPFPDGELMGDQRVVPWSDLGSDPVTRITFRAPDSTAEEFLDLAEQLGLHGVNYSVGYSAWLDVTPEGVSKGSALESLRARLGIPAQRTMAVGDQRNDLEMLAWAERGIAMGQAPQEVRAAADEVTADVDEDGLALVLEDLLTRADGPSPR